VGVYTHVCPDGLAGVIWNGQALLTCGNLCGVQSFDLITCVTFETDDVRSSSPRGRIHTSGG